MPAIGGASRLNRLVGRERALRALLSARKFKGDDAVDYGIVTAVLPVSGDPISDAVAWLAPLLHGGSEPPVTAAEVRSIKMALDGADAAATIDLGVASEGRLFDHLWARAGQLQAIAHVKALSPHPPREAATSSTGLKPTAS